MWDEITYPFPNSNSVEVWEWISNFIPHIIFAYDYLSTLGLKFIHVSKSSYCLVQIHYVNQSGLILNSTLSNKIQWNVNQNTYICWGLNMWNSHFLPEAVICSVIFESQLLIILLWYHILYHPLEGFYDTFINPLNTVEYWCLNLMANFLDNIYKCIYVPWKKNVFFFLKLPCVFFSGSNLEKSLNSFR